MNKDTKKTALAKFYFTYGTSSDYPFQGGWTLIYAPNMKAAQQIFKAFHPNTGELESSLNCADFYTEEQFEVAGFRNGNRGAYCHEVICPQPPASGEMETLASRDAKLGELWAQFGDILMNPETECIEGKFMDFPSGTHRKVIWEWFDQRHSIGVAYLLYRDGSDHTKDLAKLAYHKTMCNECDAENCAFNPDGICRFPLVYGKEPVYDDHCGCLGFADKPKTC